MIDSFLPHTVFYTNTGHESNPKWSDKKYQIDEFFNHGLDSDIVLSFSDHDSGSMLHTIANEGHSRFNLAPELTSEQAFLLTLKNSLFSMGGFIRADYDIDQNKINIINPKGFCPEFVHLIGKRNESEWLVLVSSFNGEVSYGDLAYLPHDFLKFVLSRGHYQLSPTSPVIAPLLEDKPEGPETDWDKFLRN